MMNCCTAPHTQGNQNGTLNLGKLPHPEAAWAVLKALPYHLWMRAAVAVMSGFVGILWATVSIRFARGSSKGGHRGCFGCQM